jgi:hypothetical protein
VLVCAWLAGALIARRADVAALALMAALFTARQPLKALLRGGRPIAALLVVGVVAGVAAWFVALRVAWQIPAAAGVLLAVESIFLARREERAWPSLLLGTALLSAAAPLAIGGADWRPLALVWWGLWTHFAGAALLIVGLIRGFRWALVGGVLLAILAAATWAWCGVAALGAAYTLPILLILPHARGPLAIRRLGWTQAAGSLAFTALFVLSLWKGVPS